MATERTHFATDNYKTACGRPVWGNVVTTNVALLDCRDCERVLDQDGDRDCPSCGRMPPDCRPGCEDPRGCALWRELGATDVPDEKEPV